MLAYAQKVRVAKVGKCGSWILFRLNVNEETLFAGANASNSGASNASAEKDGASGTPNVTTHLPLAMDPIICKPFVGVSFEEPFDSCFPSFWCFVVCRVGPCGSVSLVVGRSDTPTFKQHHASGRSYL